MRWPWWEPVSYTHLDVYKRQPTGCGKTTFLNTLTCLIPPTSGEILIDGEPADPKKHNLSFVFQEPSAMPWLTVEDNIAFGTVSYTHLDVYKRQGPHHRRAERKGNV